MDRVTYYDMLAGCYKLKPDVSTNIIQRLGRLESGFDKLHKLMEEYEQDKINGAEAWSHVMSTLLE